MDAPLRILHLPDVIGGHPPALAKGEQGNGAVAQTLCYDPSPYGYSADIMLGGAGKSFRRKLWERWRAFLQVRNQFDVFHFNFGASLLHAPRLGAILPEMNFYRREAARFMTFQGDDARLTYPPELDESLAEERRRGRWKGGDVTHETYVDQLRLAKRRLTIRRAARLCDHMFSLNPDLLSHLPAHKSSFLPYAIEPPVVPGLAPPDLLRPAGKPLRLVHLSTAPAIKGSGLIEKAVADAARHCNVTLDLVIQQPREAALRRLAAADYMIDQLVLGWYGGTVVEAMYLGVPAIGRICPDQAARVPELSRELPLIRTDTTSLTEVIIALANAPERRPGLVERGLAFANKWHHPMEVAKLTLAAYTEALSKRRGEKPSRG
ncbi:MAG: hypothetical protein R3D68_00035 [Hyphomicrobiaceae bacterium]